MVEKQKHSDFDNQAKQCLKILESLERDLQETTELFEDSGVNHSARQTYEKNDFKPDTKTAGFKLAKFRSRDLHQAEFDYYKKLFQQIKVSVEQAKNALTTKPLDFFVFTDLLYQAMKNHSEVIIRLTSWDIEDEQRTYWSGVTNDSLYYHESEVKSVIGTKNALNRREQDNDGTHAATEKAHQEWLRWQQGTVPYHNQTAFIDYVRQHFKKADGKTPLSVSHLKRKIKVWREQQTT